MQIAKSKGFTLVELMFVILVFGLTMTMSLPAFGKFLQTWKLHGEVDRMASTMRGARSAAIMRNIDVVFQFDVNRPSTHGQGPFVHTPEDNQIRSVFSANC